MGLIQTLNKFGHLNPDQIVRRLGDPFPNWRLGMTLTREEYNEFRATPIVLLRAGYGPESAESNVHYIGKDHPHGTIWSYGDWSRDWLGRDYYFRSQESYDANPSEPVEIRR